MHDARPRYFQIITCRHRIHRTDSRSEESLREIERRSVGEGVKERVGDLLRSLALHFVLLVERSHGFLCDGGRSKVLARKAKQMREVTPECYKVLDLVGARVNPESGKLCPDWLAAEESQG